MPEVGRADGQPGASRDPGQPSGSRAPPHQADQLVNGGGGPGIAAAVRDGDQRDPRPGYSWIPHSLLPVPDQRPLRGSAPGSTRSVQVAQPMDGYPS